MRVTVDQFRKEAMKRKRGVRRGASEYAAELREFAMAFVRKAVNGGGSIPLERAFHAKILSAGPLLTGVVAGR